MRWRLFKTKMDSYEILKTIHQVGHPMACEVVGYEKREFHGFFSCDVEVKADTDFRAVVHLSGKADEFDEELVPKPGSVIEAVVKNHAGDTLYLSTDPDDLKQVSDYQAFYRVIETLKEGTVTQGVIKWVVRFGVFVDLSCPYLGLIDIGHTYFNGGARLPYDFEDKLKVGDSINCVVSYFRFNDRQIGLGWLPKEQ